MRILLPIPTVQVGCTIPFSLYGMYTILGPLAPSCANSYQPPHHGVNLYMSEENRLFTSLMHPFLQCFNVLFQHHLRHCAAPSVRVKTIRHIKRLLLAVCHLISFFYFHQGCIRRWLGWLLPSAFSRITCNLPGRNHKFLFLKT